MARCFCGNNGIADYSPYFTHCYKMWPRVTSLSHSK